MKYFTGNISETDEPVTPARGLCQEGAPGVGRVMTKKISHLFEYLLLRLLQAVLSIIPRNSALAIGSVLGICLFLSGAYRKIIRKNMEFVNLWPPEQQKTITRKLYRMMGRYAADFLRPSTPLPPHEIKNYELVPPNLTSEVKACKER